MRLMTIRVNRILDEIIDQQLLKIDRDLSHELMIVVDTDLVRPISHSIISIGEIVQNELVEVQNLTRKYF